MFSNLAIKIFKTFSKSGPNYTLPCVIWTRWFKLHDIRFASYIEYALLRQNKGPSIYDVHTEGGGGSGSGGRMWTGGGGPAPCGRPHRKLKLEPTDVILSSSHAKKLASFLP